jgi:flagellar hook-associated protein 3 FlgL
MRPVEANWYRDFLYNLTNTKERFDTAITQSNFGKKLNHLSDNPADMAYVLTLRSKIEQIDQFEKNIETGLGFIKSAESAINAVQTAMYSIVSLTEQGASETNGANERALLADRIEATREEILNYANTEINGRFLFGGSATDTPPYYDTGLVSGGSANRPTQIGYQGNYDVLQIQADFSVTVDTNIPGNEIFGEAGGAQPPHDVFDRIDDIIQALRDDDTTVLGGAISDMHEIINQLGEAMGTYGNKSAHLNQITGMLKTFKTSLTSKMSQLEDADMAEAISNLGREEFGLQAILQAGARINRTSLMNYLG